MGFLLRICFRVWKCRMENGRKLKKNGKEKREGETGGSLRAAGFLWEKE